MRQLMTEEVNNVSGGTDLYYPILWADEEMVGYGIDITYQTICWTEKVGLFATIEHCETYPIISHFEITEPRSVVYIY